MGEGTIHGRLILDVRKKTNGCHVDLDEAELSLLVGQIPNKLYGLSREIVMDLRLKKPGLIVPMAAIGFHMIPPTKQSKKLSNLKTWLGAPMMSVLLGIKPV